MITTYLLVFIFIHNAAIDRAVKLRILFIKDVH